jgi:rare lipoprotein A (peptidoglycan hydrolase)
MSLTMILRLGLAALHIPHAVTAPPPSMQPAVASWYNDAGQTACGFHARLGFASRWLPCGARVLMRGPGGSVIAVMQDRGPYVGGRTFDLNPALKAALGCGDLCTLAWRPA